MLMVGAPGVGKTLLAERLPGILPALDDQQSLEVTSIHAIAGSLSGNGILTIPPFESPHHSSSLSAIVGSVHGHRVKPGSLTKAHHGVLFLDEAPEFARNVVEVLRQPLESGEIVLNRAHWSGVLPARFQLLMAANPCPCGNASPETPQECTCSSISKRNYAQRLSGPLLDRMDIKISMPHVESSESGEDSTTVALRVKEARERTRHRLHNSPWHVNAHVPASYLLSHLKPAIDGQELLDQYHRKSGGLRGAHRILRVAWSIADLAGHRVPDRSDIAMAIHLRERTGMLAG
jgi:magnesium chelatase family protein